MFLFNRFWSEKGQLVIPSTGVSSPGIVAVVDDLTPQLGGDLDVNGNSIVSVSDGDIPLTPDGTGRLILSSPQLGSNLDVNGNSIVSLANGDIPLTPNGSGDVILDSQKWPQADGTADQIIKTDGAGQLSYVDASSISAIWTAVPFDAGDFTGNDSMTWTVEEADVVRFRYAVLGKVVIVNFIIQSTTVGGTPSTILQIAMPGGFTIAHPARMLGIAIDNGAAMEVLRITSQTTTDLLNCILLDITSWAAATNATSVEGTMIVEVA